MVHDGFAFFTKNEIRDKMRVNEDLSETKHGMKSTSTQVDINQGTSCSRHCKKIFLIFQKLSLVCLISASARHGQKIYYHRKKSMVFKVTIAIDGMVHAQPLGPMVFQWFSVSQSLVTMF